MWWVIGCSFLGGVAVTLAGLYAALRFVFRSLDTSAVPPLVHSEVQHSRPAKAFLADHPRPPSELQRDELPTETAEALNLLAGLLFRELRDTPGMRRFFLQILHNDLLVRPPPTADAPALTRGGRP